MLIPASLRRLALLLVAGASSLSGFAQNRVNDVTPGGRKITALEAEKDNPTLRREAMRMWYGGDWSPEYRRFVMGVAAQEAERWGSTIPGNRLLPLAVQGNHWTSLGPTNANREWNQGNYNAIDSGRPRSVIVDPTNASIIYNATSGGGIWKSLDAGSTWNCITDGLGSLSSGALGMDPTDHLTLYYGLGDAFDGTGSGVFKTTDGGNTWTTLSFGLGNVTVINGIGVGSANNQIVLAATNDGLYRSMNGGGTFSRIIDSTSTGKAVNPTCWSLAWSGGQNWVVAMETDPADASGLGTAEIWYSSDDGETWTKATGITSPTYTKKGKQVPVGITRITLASAPSERATLYAYGAVYATWGGHAELDLANMWRSTDAGHTWASMGTTAGYNAGSFSTNYSNSNADSVEPGTMLGGQAWYNQMLIVDPVTPTTLYAGGNLALVKITNAKTTPVYAVQSNWLAQYSQPYIHADIHAAGFGPAPNYDLWVGSDGGVFKRTDPVTNAWIYTTNVGINSHLCYSVGSTLGNGTATDRARVITGLQDNGTRVRVNSTSIFDQTNGGDGFAALIHPTNSSLMLSTLYYTRVYRSTDYGQTWTNNPTISGDWFWTKVTPWQGDTNGNTVYTFKSTTAHKSTDFASTWGQLGTTGLPPPDGQGNPTYSIRNIGAAKSNGSVLGMVLSGGRAYTSINGGTSWTQTGAIPNNNLSMSYISFSPQNASIVYLASVAAGSGFTHLWKSSNGGVQVDAFDTGTGFPQGVPVNAVVEDPNDNQTVYAATHLGVYRTTNGGGTWARFGTGLPLVNVTDLWIAPDSSFLRVSTFGRGIWEFDTNTGTVAISVSAPASDSTVNSGQVVGFTASGSDTSGGTLSYKWNFGDNASGTGATVSHPYVNYGATALPYPATVTAYGSNGGYSLATRNITVATSTPATSVSITQSPASPQAGQPVTFTAAGAGSNAVGIGYQYQWWVWDASRGSNTNGGWVMMQDFGGSNSFTQVLPAGTYGVGVDVRTRTAVAWDIYTAVNSYTVAPIMIRAGEVQMKAPAAFDAAKSFREFHEQRLGSTQTEKFLKHKVAIHE